MWCGDANGRRRTASLEARPSLRYAFRFSLAPAKKNEDARARKVRGPIMWQYQMIKNEKGMHVMHARCGMVEIRATGSDLDEVWEFASVIERAADELIIPLIGGETGARPLTN